MHLHPRKYHPSLIANRTWKTGRLSNYVRNRLLGFLETDDYDLIDKIRRFKDDNPKDFEFTMFLLFGIDWKLVADPAIPTGSRSSRKPRAGHQIPDIFHPMLQAILAEPKTYQEKL